MDFKEVNEFILSEMEKNIKKVLDREVDSVTLHHVRPNDVIKCVEKLGGADNDDLDTNGWQWDYWMKFEHNDNTFMLSGDGFYSNTCCFSYESED